MPVPSGISKAQPATDGGSLCWTITQHISAWQPLSNNNNKKKNPHKSSQFCSRWWWKSYFKTYAHWCTRTTDIHIQYYWSHAVTHDGETLKNILVHCSFSFSRHLCIFASTINSVLACKHTHTYTHILKQIHSQLNKFRGGVFPCQSQEESSLLLQIRDKALLCAKLVSALGEKNS